METDTVKRKNVINFKENVERVRRFILEDLWEFELSRFSRIKAFLYHQLQVAYIVAKGFLDDKCLLRASALTYVTLLSLVPFLAIVVAISKGLKIQNKLIPLLIERLNDLGLSEVGDKIINFIGNIDAATLGGLGLSVFLFTAIGLLSSIEKSFNEIWGIKTSRTLFRKFSDYLSVLIICPVLVTAAFTATTFLQAKLLSDIPTFNVISRPFLRLAPFASLWIALTCIYIFMPNSRVKFKCALLGGIIGGTLWQLAQWGYVRFQLGMAIQYQAIYGTLASIPLFLIWLYISWIIVLFGAEISFAHQNVVTYRLEKRALSVSPSFKEALGLRLALAIGEKFYLGREPWTASKLAAAWNIPIRLINELLFQLSQSKIILEMTNRDTYYQPARTLEKIMVKDVLDAIRNYGGSPTKMEKEDRVKELLAKVDKITERELGSLSLKDVILTPTASSA